MAALKRLDLEDQQQYLSLEHELIARFYPEEAARQDLEIDYLIKFRTRGPHGQHTHERPKWAWEEEGFIHEDEESWTPADCPPAPMPGHEISWGTTGSPTIPCLDEQE